MVSSCPDGVPLVLGTQVTYLGKLKTPDAYAENPTDTTEAVTRFYGARGMDGAASAALAQDLSNHTVLPRQFRINADHKDDPAEKLIDVSQVYSWPQLS
jgi:hypothetical protein